MPADSASFPPHRVRGLRPGPLEKRMSRARAASTRPSWRIASSQMPARTLQPFDETLVAPWRLGAGRRGVLLLHGFAGTPPELRRLGEHLAAHGWRCHAPALPGHAATPEALEDTAWHDWARAAFAGPDDPAASCHP